MYIGKIYLVPCQKVRPLPGGGGGGGGGKSICPYNYDSVLVISFSQLRTNSILQHVPLISIEDLPALASEPLAPDAVPAGGQDPIGVQGILDRLIELPQGATAPAVRLGDLVGEEQMRPVLAVALVGGFTDHLAHEACGTLFGVPVRAVIDDVGNVMHLAARDTHGRKYVEAILGVQPADDAVDDGRVLPLCRRDGREEQVRRVGDPVQPVQFAERGHAAAHGHARVQVMVLR